MIGALARPQQCVRGGRLEPIRGLANRLPDHAARLAAVVMLSETVDAAEVDEAAMERGIELARYYAGEALRIVDAERVKPELRQAETVRRWLLEAWSEPLISTPDLYQRGPNAIRYQKTASDVLAVLEEHGHLWRAPGPDRRSLAELTLGARRESA